MIRLPLLGLILAAAAAGGGVSDGGLESLDRRDKFYGAAARGDVVIVVGYPGRLLRSADRGATWTSLPAGTDEALYSIDLAGEKGGAVVGRGGIVLVTRDGGLTWKPGKSGVGEPLFDVDLVDGQSGFAVGHFNTILHTEDGGLSWSRQRYELPEDAEEEPGLNGVSFVDPLRGWIVGEFGTILHTEDGGRTWRAQKSGVASPLYDVVFGDDKHGIAAGAKGLVLETADGGAVWTRTPTPTDKHLFALSAAAGAVWIVGEQGVILERAAGGKEFADRSAVVYTWLDGAVFLDAVTGFAVGGRGHILRTADEGRNWRRLSGR